MRKIQLPQRAPDRQASSSIEFDRRLLPPGILPDQIQTHYGALCALRRSRTGMSLVLLCSIFGDLREGVHNIKEENSNSKFND